MIIRKVKNDIWYKFMTRIDFVNLLNKSGYSIGVELGVFKGEFSKVILSNWGGTLYLIDVWRGLEDYDDMSNNQYHPDAYTETIKNITGFEERAFMLRMSGDKAIELFRDYSLDFVYIDANHTYESVKKDIELWYPKIRFGGIFSGHDYLPKNLYMYRNNEDKNIPVLLGDENTYAGMFGVNPAVDEFIERYGFELHLTDEFLGTWWVVK